MHYFFAIPAGQLAAATQIQQDICGISESIFNLGRARGASRAAAWLYAHGTIPNAAEFAEKISEIGVVVSTDNQPQIFGMQEMLNLGDIRRPDLDQITVAKLREFAESERVDLTGLTKKSDIIDAFENPDRRLP